MKYLKKMKKIELTWREGAYLDPMSIVHFLAGVLAYYLFMVILNLSFPISFGVTLLGAFLWEMFEVSINVIEKLSNKVVDICLPLASFLLVHNFVPEDKLELVFATSLSAFLILGFVGAYYYFRHQEGL